MELVPVARGRERAQFVAQLVEVRQVRSPFVIGESSVIRRAAPA
jgi:hypothetical protein